MAAPPVSLDSIPLSSSSRSAKRRRVSPNGSPSTSQGSSVTAICLGDTDTFDGRSNDFRITRVMTKGEEVE